MSGAWSWVVAAGKAVLGVLKTVVVWAWEHPIAASVAAITWLLIRREYERRKARGETTPLGDFLADLLGSAGDYVATMFAVVSVGRGVYSMFADVAGAAAAAVAPPYKVEWFSRVLTTPELLPTLMW